MTKTIFAQAEPLPITRSAMHFRPRIKRVASCVGAVLAQLSCGLAFADSAVGVDTALGNAMNPPGRSAIPRPLAEDGYDTVRRSPSGQLYGQPIDQNTEVTRTEGGWTYSGGVEGGVLTGDANTRSTLFRKYKDLRNGAYLNYFEVEADKAETASYLQTFGGGTGRDDQFYGLQMGVYNDWKVRAFYNETPHVYSSNFKPIFKNNGSNKPSLDNGTAGGAAATTAAALVPYAKTLPDTEVSIVRKKGGIRLDMNLSDDWKAYASASQEHRIGERPFSYQDSGVAGGAAGPAIEGVEPIDYKTTDLLAGVQYADKLTAINLRASASLFTNDISTLYTRRALMATNAAPTTVAAWDSTVYSLAPDNQAYSLKGEATRKLPDFYRGVLSGSVAWSTSRQNDALRMPVDPGMSASMVGAGGVATAANSGNLAFDPRNWNGVNGSPLTRSSAGQRIDSNLINLSLALHPVDELSVKGTIRHFATKNKSGTYNSYNPLTGQWFAGFDSNLTNAAGTPAFTLYAAPNANGLLGCQPAPGYTAPAGCGFASAAAGTAAVTAFMNGRSLVSPPRDNKQTTYTLSADYDLGNTASVEGVLERENYSHTFRERDKTWEDKLKLTYVNRALADMTLRASYEHARKRGSSYDPLVTTRMGIDWFSIYGVTYSRAALQSLIASAGTGGIYPTLASVRNWLLGGNGSGGNGNSGGFMKPDQADRNQNILNLRLNYLAREDLDVGAAVQLKAVRYPTSEAGVKKDDLHSYNLDFNYQPMRDTQFSAFFSRQEGSQRQTENYGVNPATGAAFTNVTLPAYVQGICGGLTGANIDCWLNNQRPASANVDVDTKNINNVLGLGMAHDFGAIKFGLNYTYSRARTSITSVYGPNALTAANQTVLNTFGGLPDITTDVQTVETNLVIPIDKKLSARLMYRYENARVRDWHYDYYSILPTTQFIPADYGPQNYHASVLGVFFQFKL